METSTLVEVATLLSENETLSDEGFAELIVTVRGGVREHEKFESDLRGSLKRMGDISGVNPETAMKVGQSLFAVGKFGEAVAWLDRAGSGQAPCHLKGRALKASGDYPGAIKAFEQAENKGHDSFECGMSIVDCLRQGGELEQAEQKLKRLSRGGEIRAEYHYQRGRLHEANGLHEESMTEYAKAIELDGHHSEALFYLAYACDLYGDENEAIEYYDRCIQSGPVHVNALLNLAVLSEEAGEYDKAKSCVMRVLAAYPNHARARLFLKDILSSATMMYDEEQKRQIDRRNQVLDIPISDFELSVRSRNCLKKMNIRTLGDLLQVTEQELLAYKNFGETSLHEIKQILNQRDLKLGFLQDEDKSNLLQSSDENEEDEKANELLHIPISELGLSIRAKKCLQRLNLETIGSLVKYTEAELLGCKNFGMISLREIKERLHDRGLLLRQLED